MIHYKINYNNELVLPLCLNVGDDSDVADMQVNDNGDLIVVLSNGRAHNLGQIIGKDGMIYKPHIEKDEHNVFTFTIMNEPEDMEV